MQGQGNGKSYLRLSSTCRYEFWEAFEIEYVPTGGLYDSITPAVLASHLAEIDGAGVDFILLDLTNGIHHIQR